MSLLGRIEQFVHGVDLWNDYWEMIDQYFKANEITDNAKRTATFLTLIGKETYSLLNSLMAPEKPSSKKVEELNAILNEHLEPKPIVIAERHKFYNRVQFEAESVATYIMELRKLTIHCEFNAFLNEALRDKFVCGLYDAGMRKRLLTEKKLDLKTAVNIAKSMESAKKESKEMIAETTSTYAMKEQKTKRKCYRCDSEFHLANACRHKNTKCNNCSRNGHLAKVCRSEKKRSNGGTSRNFKTDSEDFSESHFTNPGTSNEDQSDEEEEIYTIKKIGS